jgi:hypothetical protein
MKIQVGQTVYLEPTGNACRYSKEIVETKVIKVGRKYFEVENKHIKFDIDNMCEVSNYCSNWSVYLSRQEIEDKNEKESINRAMRELFGTYGRNNLSLEQLRQIQKITEQNMKAIYNIPQQPQGATENAAPSAAPVV